ncbi:hypothetical protein BGX28_002288 [Mortierella sp. GBA30]|nr:hypothetical protein BGX28_002288 [Mortierella sp. GBA30]
MVHLAILSSKIDTGLSQLSTNARMKLSTTMQAKRLLRGQWRPALMLGITMSSLTVFWLFYYVDARRIANVGPNTPWIQTWLLCIMTNGAKGVSAFDTQTICAKEIASDLPSIPWFTTAEMLHAVIGIVVALVFVSKAEFWSEWSFLLSNVFKRGKLGKGSRGRRSPPSPASTSYNHNPRQYQHYDPNMRKGARVGYNDSLPGAVATAASADEAKPAPSKDTNGTQWYDMDDLLDKEYEVQRAGTLQRSVSFGSRTLITSSDLPRYPTDTSQDLHTGDILYKAPSLQSDTKGSSSAPTSKVLAIPDKAYLVANDDSHRYVDHPVVPRPVLRAGAKPRNDQQQPQRVFLSSPPRSPTFPATTSLSPIPSKSRRSSLASSSSRGRRSDSVPTMGGVNGSSALGSSQSSPVSVKSAKDANAIYDSNENGDQVMVASRQSLTGATGKRLNRIKQEGNPLLEPSKPNAELLDLLDPESSSSLLPVLPTKSPARHHQAQHNLSEYKAPPPKSPPRYPISEPSWQK